MIVEVLIKSLHCNKCRIIYISRMQHFRTRTFLSWILIFKPIPNSYVTIENRILKLRTRESYSLVSLKSQTEDNGVG